MRYGSFAVAMGALWVLGCGGGGTGTGGDGGGGTTTTTTSTSTSTGGSGGIGGTGGTGGTSTTTTTGGVVFVGRPAPKPVFVTPQSSSIVNGNIEVVVDNEVDPSGLASGEIYEPAVITLKVEVSDDFGASYEVLADGIEQGPFDNGAYGWVTDGLLPTPQNQFNQYTLKATLTDDQGQMGTATVDVRVNQAPVIDKVQVVAIDDSQADPVFSFAAEATDPDGDSGQLAFEWYFQWDGTTATGTFVDKAVPAALVNAQAPVIVEVYVTDAEGGMGEATGDAKPAAPPFDVPDAGFCKCLDMITTKEGAATNTIPAMLPFEDPERADALKAATKEKGFLQLTRKFTVTLPIEGDPRLCRHWQVVRGVTTIAADPNQKWAEKPPKFAKAEAGWHDTVPAPMEGKKCGPMDPFCLDGFLYIKDTSNTQHRKGMILFNDEPGFPHLEPHAFYLGPMTGVPTPLSMKVEFEAHCVGTDGVETTKKGYAFEAGVNETGKPVPDGSPKFTP